MTLVAAPPSPDVLTPPVTSARPAVRVLGTALLFAVSCALALVLAEVLVRLFAPQQLVALRPDVWQPADSIGWTFRPNLNTIVNTGERPVHVFTDANGFRVGRSGAGTARTRALLIGDSFMAALQVEYEQSFAGLLEQRLPGRIGSPFAIRNTGQAGWDPPQYLIQARRMLDRDTFALVIVSVYLGNDIVTRWPSHIPPLTPVETYRFRLPHRFSAAEFVAAVLRPTNDILKRHSHAFIFFKSRLHTTLMRLGLAAVDFPEEFQRSEARSGRWDLTAGILADIADMAARRGIPTLFVLVPAPFQVEPDVFQAYLRGFRVDASRFDLDQPTRFMKERLEARGLEVIDVLPAFRAADARGPKLYGTIDPHLTPRGHDVLEQLVEPRVIELLAKRR